MKPLINNSLKTIVFLDLFSLSGHISYCVARIYLFIYLFSCLPPSLPTPYGCRSNNVKHFALASFCNLQFPNVRPVESRSDNGHGLPPIVFVPPYLPSINATAGVSCNNTCTSELSAWERERRGRQENRGREQREEAEKKRRRREKQLKLGWGCHDRPALCGHVNVACQLNGAARGWCDWWLVECMLSLSIIVAEHNQTGASRTEDALTAVIIHRHGDHFWPAVDGRRMPLLQSAFNQIGLSVVR